MLSGQVMITVITDITDNISQFGILPGPTRSNDE